MATMNEVRFLDVWQVHGDGGERSVGPVIGYFEKHWDAETFAKGKGYYGSDGAVVAAKAVSIRGDVYILGTHNPIDLNATAARADDELKRNTLAALSDAQLRVLGLKREPVHGLPPQRAPVAPPGNPPPQSGGPQTPPGKP